MDIIDADKRRNTVFEFFAIVMQITLIFHLWKKVEYKYANRKADSVMIALSRSTTVYEIFTFEIYITLSLTFK